VSLATPIVILERTVGTTEYTEHTEKDWTAALGLLIRKANGSRSSTLWFSVYSVYFGGLNPRLYNHTKPACVTGLPGHRLHDPGRGVQAEEPPAWRGPADPDCGYGQGRQFADGTPDGMPAANMMTV
jgi:hypothetical protein